MNSCAVFAKLTNGDFFQCGYNYLSRAYAEKEAKATLEAVNVEKVCVRKVTLKYKTIKTFKKGEAK